MTGTPATVPRASVVRTLGVARPAAGRLSLASLLGAGAIAASIGLMGTSAWLISRSAQHPQESALALAIVAVQFFGLSRGICRYGERLVGHDAAFRVLAALRVRVYRQLERLAPAGLPAFRHGDLLARIVQDVDALQDVALRVVPPFAIALVVGAGTVALEWWILPAAGVVLLIALVVGAVAVPWLTGMLSRRSARRQAVARGDLATAMVDLVDGAAELVAFGRMREQVDRVRRADARLTGAASKAAGSSGVGLAAATLLAGLAAWGAATAGVVAVHDGRLPGVELAVIALVPLAAFELVAGLPVATQALQRSRHAAGRVFEVLDAPVPVHDPEHPSPVPAPPYEVAARSLTVRYPGAREPAVRSVDLRLPPGHRVAVVGPSGAGKSTLAAALLRFLPYDGSLTLDGTELAELAGHDVRCVIGSVDQGVHLFDTTLGQNLRLGRPDSTEDELYRVLDRVGLGPWARSLPQGLATEVGHEGGRLSGGQRQRVAVARALLAAFPVLVLDEPAEHLDPAAADALTADLLELTEGQSTLLITHRLAGLDAVDEVLMLEGGRVVERGTHDHLLELDGRYAQLWRDELASDLAADVARAVATASAGDRRPVEVAQ